MSCTNTDSWNSEPDTNPRCNADAAGRNAISNAGRNSDSRRNSFSDSR